VGSIARLPKRQQTRYSRGKDREGHCDRWTNVAASGADEPTVVPTAASAPLGRLLIARDIGGCWRASVAVKGRPAGLPAFFSKPAGLWGGYVLKSLEDVLHLLVGILQAGLSLVRPPFGPGVVIPGGPADGPFDPATQIVDLVLILSGTLMCFYFLLATTRSSFRPTPQRATLKPRTAIRRTPSGVDARVQLPGRLQVWQTGRSAWAAMRNVRCGFDCHHGVREHGNCGGSSGDADASGYRHGGQSASSVEEVFEGLTSRRSAGRRSARAPGPTPLASVFPNPSKRRCAWLLASFS
jgi:hypothetical protein